MRISLPSALLLLSSFASGQSSPELSTELRALSAGWNANASKINSLAFSGKIHIVDKSLLDFPDLDGRTFDSQTAAFCVWAEKNRLRSDVSWDRTVNLTDRRLNYNLPLADYMVPGGVEVDQKAVLRLHGTTQTTFQSIYTNDFQADLTREARILNIDPRGAPPGLPSPFKSILDQAIIADLTLPEYLLASLRYEHTVRSAVHKREDGTYAIDFYWCHGKDRRDEPSGHTMLTLDPDRGCCVTRCTSTISGVPVADTRYEYTAVDGMWVMTRQVRKFYQDGENDPSKSEAIEIDANSLMVNAPIDPNVYTLEVLAIPKGTYIKDRIKNAEYLYNDIPLHLKVAVSEAERELEKLPESLFHERQSTGAPSPEKQASPRASTRPVSPGVVAADTGESRAWVYAVPITVAGVAGILALAVLLAKRRKAT